MRGFSISAGTILQLYVHHPHWRLSVGLRVLAALLAAATITCDALILKWKPAPAGVPWYSFHSITTVVTFIVCSLSIIWAISSLLKLFVTLKPVHPGADIGVDLVLSLLLAPTIVLAILGLANSWLSDGKYGTQTVAGRLELAAIVCLIIMFSVHFAFFVWACRRVDVRRRTERRESCDRCLTMKLREDMASHGSNIDATPSRAYHKAQESHSKFSTTTTSSSGFDIPPFEHQHCHPSPPTALLPSFTSPIYTETLPTPIPFSEARYHELDVEQKHISYPPISPRTPQYRFEESDDDEELIPPTPPPKPQYREPEDRMVIPRLDVRPFKRPYGMARLRDERRDDPRLGAPSRAYSISSYYYDNRNEF